MGKPGHLARPLRKLAMLEGPKAVAPLAVMVRARDTRLFSGVVSKHQFPPVSRATLRLMGGRYGDFRNWPDIDAWAASISDRLLEGTRSARRRSAPELD